MPHRYGRRCGVWIWAPAFLCAVWMFSLCLLEFWAQSATPKLMHQLLVSNQLQPLQLQLLNASLPERLFVACLWIIWALNSACSCLAWWTQACRPGKPDQGPLFETWVHRWLRLIVLWCRGNSAFPVSEIRFSITLNQSPGQLTPSSLETARWRRSALIRRLIKLWWELLWEFPIYLDSCGWAGCPRLQTVPHGDSEDKHIWVWRNQKPWINS